MASYKKYDTKQGKRWMYIIDVGIDPATGKRKQKKVRGFKKKEDAENAAAKVKIEIADGTYVNEENITFEAFSKKWLSIYSQNVKVSSVRTREQQLDKLLNTFACVQMAKITGLMYQNFLNDLHKKEYAKSTIEGIHSTGSMVFKLAKKLKVIKNAPTEHAVLPKKLATVEELENQENDIKYLEKDELGHFLNTAKEKELESEHMVFTLLAFSGIRLGELLALKWSDIDFKVNTISITKTMYNPKHNQDFQLLPPKTKSSVRRIKVDIGVLKLLKHHKAKQSEVRLLASNRYYDGNFVFARRNGYPETSSVIRSRMKRLLELASINKGITPHSMRHTHTSLLIEAGVGVKEIQQRLGHADIKTTMDIYAHVTKDMEEKASQKFSDLMKGFIN